MRYIITKGNEIAATCSDYFAVVSYINGQSDNNACKIWEQKMENIVCRCTYIIDGEGNKTCIYNNTKWFIENAENVMTNYESYKVIDILGKEIGLDRFGKEFNLIKDRLASIDGRPGQIKYDMEVGQEFVSLFREECILTKFTKESNTSPMIIFSKLATVISMLSAGAFREARQWLQSYRNTIKDDFLTDERIDKYIDMLNSADAIEYATEEDYFYVVPERTEANEFLEE